jgi:hypothetical protein
MLEPDRTSAQVPAHAEESWKDLRARLFGKDCLLPNLRSSVEWRAKLVAVQNSLGNTPLAKPLKNALENFSFAPQRWNSEALVSAFHYF